MLSIPLMLIDAESSACRSTLDTVTFLLTFGVSDLPVAFQRFIVREWKMKARSWIRLCTAALVALVAACTVQVSDSGYVDDSTQTQSVQQELVQPGGVAAPTCRRARDSSTSMTELGSLGRLPAATPLGARHGA